MFIGGITVADSHTISIVLKGKEDYVALGSFLKAGDALKTILEELDAVLSETPHARIRWALSNLSLGSAAAEVTGTVAEGQADHTPALIAACVDGLAQVDEGVVRPPHFTDSVLKGAKSLTAVLQEDVERIIVARAAKHVTVTQRVAANVDELLGATYVAPSYIEGRLEAISIHDRRIFAVWEPIHNWRIECRFPQDMLEEVRDALGNRVSVKGNVRFDARDKPLSVQADSMYVFPDEDALPSTKDLIGLDPDFTSGQDSVEYVRRMRDARG